MNDPNDKDDPMNETPSKFTIDLAAPDLTACPCHHCGVWRAWAMFQAYAALALHAGHSLEVYMENIWTELPEEVKRIVVSTADIIPPGGPCLTTSADAKNLLEDIAQAPSKKREFDYKHAVAQVHQAMRRPQSEESDA